jgi:ribosomal protein S6--L-glutamate ligase
MDLTPRIEAGEIKVAVGSRLLGVGNVLTLGVRPNVDDYDPVEMGWIQAAPKIYYPTRFLAQPLSGMGKELFPGISSYFYTGDKIRQTTLFKLLGVPHPRTRVYYPNHHEDILREFAFPFVAKVPRSSDSGRGVYLVRSREDLDAYLSRNRVAYLQEWLSDSRDYRVVVIGGKVVLSYERRRPAVDFRANVAIGGKIEFGEVPDEVCRTALETAHVCAFDDVGIDVLVSEGVCMVLEANFRYGRKGFKAAGVDYKRMLEGMLMRGDI